ncbi:MAG TPA: tripartite tricarboxylate transporter substrate binding protein, partial [Burkholderiales bacterium]|nr:tripartite tricarboxylate transporter substrate binding protein [Burkholderiales bacterium]
MRFPALCASLCCATFFCIGGAVAQTPAAKPATSYPSKPLRIIIPYPPGGTSDILARLLGVKLTESWGQTVLVDNRTGANGNIGAEFVARAPADGYTYLVTDIGNLSVAPNVFKLNYDPHRDLATVTTISYSPHMLTTHPSLPVKNIRELIAFAKANPGKLNLPTGMGGATHFGAMEIAQRTGIKWTYIGTRGGSDSSRSVMSGETEILLLGMLQTIPHVKSGRLKLIAVSSEKRLASLPDTPTISEGPGLAGFVSGSWQGMLAPAKTPPEIIEKMNAEMARILAMPDIKEKLQTQGTEPLPAKPQVMTKWMTTEKERNAKLI